METKNTIPLSQVDEGFLVSVVGVDAGRGLRNRLISMGLFPKTQVRVVRNDGSGPFVISVKNSRIALGRGGRRQNYGNVVRLNCIFFAHKLGSPNI